eukprot:COSAG05_NODE_988_length_6284_cov_7.662571_8_plen_149_part_00
MSHCTTLCYMYVSRYTCTSTLLACRRRRRSSKSGNRKRGEAFRKSARRRVSGCPTSSTLVRSIACSQPTVPRTGAWQYHRPCAQRYVGKYQSCMVQIGPDDTRPAHTDTDSLFFLSLSLSLSLMFLRVQGIRNWWWRYGSVCPFPDNR